MSVSLDPVTGYKVERMLDQLTAEFVGRVGREQIEPLLDDEVTRIASAATILTFVPLLAYRRTRERLKSITRAVAADNATWDVVFVSVSGGARVQIAAALTTHLSSGRVRTHAAGTAVTRAVGPTVRAALAEIGVDPEHAIARPVTDAGLRAADVIVTMGGRRVGVLDAPAHVRHEEWRVGDPIRAPLSQVRDIRANIEHRVHTLLAELGCPHPARGTRFRQAGPARIGG